jgi:hypothetical protein
LQPDKFWKLTLRQVLLLIHQNSHRDAVLWDKVRNLEFASYATTFAGMSGERVFKKINKPTDLYKLPTDSKLLSSIKIDKERATEDVNKMKQLFSWQKKDSISTK